jgi:hypothetical protein
MTRDAHGVPEGVGLLPRFGSFFDFVEREAAEPQPIVSGGAIVMRLAAL